VAAWLDRPGVRDQQNKLAQARHLRRLKSDPNYRRKKVTAGKAAKAKRRRALFAQGISTHRPPPAHRVQ
jgi:hypothetical protein